jgi:hypothetical protein
MIPENVSVYLKASHPRRLYECSCLLSREEAAVDFFCTNSGRQVAVETEFVLWRLIRVGAACYLNDGANNFKVASRKVKVKQSWTGLEGSRKLRLPDFKTIGT